MSESSKQIDWISIDDRRSAARRLLEQAAERVGITELAHWLQEDPSTIRNQLAHRDRRRPSSELQTLCFLLDAEYRRHLAGLLGELVSKPPDLTPAQALREILVKATSLEWGRAAAEAIGAIAARTRMEPEP